MTVLNMSELSALQAVVECAERTAKVARFMPDTETIVYGIARQVCDEHGFFLTNRDDVRDGFLRVTGRSGWEFFWPIRELMAQVPAGEFCQYDWDHNSK